MTEETPNAAKALTLSRRTMLAATPSIQASEGTGVIPLPLDAETPILGLFRRWAAARAASYHATEAEYEVISDRMSALEKDIFALPSTSPADMAAKVASFTNFGDFELPHKGRDEGRRFWGEVESLLSAPALTGASEASPERDPLTTLLDEWRDARSAYEARSGNDEEADQALFQRMCDLADKIIEAEPVTQEEAAAQLEVMMLDGMVEDHSGGQAKELVSRLIASLRTGLGGRVA